MHLFLIEVESGLTLAAIYALLAVSLTFTYRVTGVVQLAQGDIMTCGAFAGYFVGTHVASLPLVLLAALATTSVLGFVFYQTMFRWLLNVGSLPPLVVGLALSTGIEETLRIAFFGGNPEPFPPLSWVSKLSTGHLDLLIIGIAAIVGIIFELTLRRTQVGRSIRATADNVEMARILGLRADRIRMFAFVIGAALAGIAGVLVAIVYQSIGFNYGPSLEFTAIACILLGGLGSIPGALLGSLVVGLGQALISTYVSSSYVTALVFGLVLVVIIVRPSGIFGSEGLAHG